MAASQEQICDKIRQGIIANLTARLPPGRVMAIDLRSLSMFVERISPNPINRALSIGDLTNRRAWSCLGPFGGVVATVLTSVPETSRILNDTEAALYSAARLACQFARRLVEQMGAEGSIECSAEPIPTSLSIGTAPLGNSGSTVVHMCLTAANEAILRGIRMIATQTKPQPAMLALSRRSDGIHVSWLGAMGEMIQEQPIEVFLGLPCAHLSRLVLREREARRQRGGADAARQTLRSISPKIAEAVEIAVHQQCPVGVRLCVTRDRKDIPTDAWLYVHPGYPTAGKSAVMLSSNRGHDEFLLEARDGSQYYFPPCLLTARLTFSEGGMLVERPFIRQPQNGYGWAHPFTGWLNVGPLALSDAIARDPEDAVLLTPSKEAQKLFPQLATRGGPAREGHICLHGHEDRMRRLQAALVSDIRRGALPDVLGIITDLHEIARFGITTAHQNNGAGPQGALPYPLQGRPVTGSLAKRVFAYSPRKECIPGNSHKQVAGRLDHEALMRHILQTVSHTPEYLCSGLGSVRRVQGG